MSKPVKVEAGITITVSGEVVLRTAVERGSSRSVCLRFPSVDAARTGKAHATRVREAGGDVVQELCGLGGFLPADAATTKQKARPAAARAARVRTLNELADGYEEWRRSLVEMSDHTRRASPKKGHVSLRPNTFDVDQQRVRLYLREDFGDLEVTDISRQRLREWTLRMAEQGLAVKTVNKVLALLRQMVGEAARSERPDDFPWRGISAISPKNPRRKLSDPSKWGGTPGSADPLLTFVSMDLLARAERAPFRAAIYIEALGGPRIGEGFGLQIGDFTWEDGFLWTNIERQLDCQNRTLPWVKSDASYRKIPLAPILAEYLIEYAWRYHGCDLRAPDPELLGRQFIVNPAGRDLDGSFLPGLRSNFASRLGKIRDGVGLTHDRLGYLVDTHHLRKSVSTYLLHAEDILRAIDRDEMPEDPEDPEALILFLRERLAYSPSQLAAFSGGAISKYLGQEQNEDAIPDGAAAVTLGFYNLAIESTEPFKAIARTIDRIARYEIQSLCSAQDPEDLLPVHQLDDAEWMLSEDAAALVGIGQSNIWEAVQRGDLDGHLGWRADGGYLRNRQQRTNVPAKPRLYVSVSSAKEFKRQREMPSVKEVARRLGMSWEAVGRNFIDTGRVHAQMTAGVNRVNPDHADDLLNELHDAVLDCFDPGRWYTVESLTAVFNDKHGALFVEGRALSRWVEAWAGALVQSDRLRQRSETTGGQTSGRRPVFRIQKGVEK